jgi:hypothetical protein
MADTKSLLLCYDHRIPLLDVFLNYGTRKMKKNGTPSPLSGPVFNISR